MKAWRTAGWYATSLVILVVFLFPIYWMFSVSLKKRSRFISKFDGQVADVATRHINHGGDQAPGVSRDTNKRKFLNRLEPAKNCHNIHYAGI